ncbi:MAG: type I pullulanase [Bacilli bacterium]|nr:type I pullulanase [Bacilli bacterium]
MKDTYLNAKLISPDLLRLVVFSSLPYEKLEPVLWKDGVSMGKPTVARTSTLSSISIVDLRLNEPLELGHSYSLVMPQYGSVPVDVTEATTFPGFDEEFHYKGNDLGYTYSKKYTGFALWAPLASKVVLSYRKKPEDPWSVVEMIRCDHGVFKGRVYGDLHLAEYHYHVTNSEVTVKVTDPYAKGSTLNGENSVVIDFGRLKDNDHPEALPVLNSPCDAIIYEGHVRDLTIDPHTDIREKGRFKGLVEEGRKTEAGHPAGFDYIKSLGITHLQLLPIYDYKTVDESKPSSGYNWGYDPAQYFVPEGSYASNLEDPLSRIVDCRDMVAKFHQAGIRIVMDVVYNHVYEYQNSVFEKVVPNYYFRRRANSKLANTSGCGNDLATERPMVRKLIVDACRHWIETYHIDGFRFDLMGIIDVETLQQIRAMARSHDPRFLLYGEGWNMGGEVSVPLGHMGNANLLPEFGFFNDFYRETLKNYAAGDFGAKNAFKNALAGSCIDFILPPKFASATQTINYVECHDNATFFDFLSMRRRDYSLETKLEIIQGVNAAILFSFGIPFFHAGQEIGMSKWEEDNTYNKGDGYNKFSYRLLDERYEMAENFKKMVAIRKKSPYLRIYDPRLINQAIDVGEINDTVRLSFVEKNLIAPEEEVHAFFNASGRDETYWAPTPLEKVFDSSHQDRLDTDPHAVIIPAHSTVLTRGKKA